jgi:hypothetical protein
MKPGDRVWLGLWLMGMNPITILMVLPLLMLMAGALLLGWLFIKSVEVICRMVQNPTSAVQSPHFRRAR